MDFTVWLAFVVATIMLLLIRWPTVLLVLSYAIGRGRKVAITTALGVAGGGFVAMTASLIGLGALVLVSASLFIVLKWIGAICLIWLGYKLLRSAVGAVGAGLTENSAAPSISQSKVFGHAAAVIALNLKSIAFIIAFVPQFTVLIGIYWAWPGRMPLFTRCWRRKCAI